MDSAEPGDVTQILRTLSAGDPEAAGRLMELVYPELRKVASSYFQHEPAGHMLEPTALVHEAYIKLVGQQDVQWEGRTHFFAVGALAMRRILVDYARQRRRANKDLDQKRIELKDDLLLSHHSIDDVLAVEDALCKLAEVDPQQAKIAEMRFFGGLTVADVAVALKVSKRTVEAEWTMTKAWLRRELGGMPE